jgi:hypothetical protein
MTDTPFPPLSAEQKKISLSGRLSMDLLFAGSKSEGRYPVLHAEDGRAYRAHVKGEVLSRENILSGFAGTDVTLHGVVDDLRGHWRITLDPADEGMIVSTPVEHDAGHEAEASASVADAGTDAGPGLDARKGPHE